MEESLVILMWFFGFIAVVLNTILFFKVWGMTNNVSKILELMKDEQQKSIKDNSAISVGDRVFIRPMKKESRVVSIKQDVGLYECESNVVDGWFERGDLDKI